MIFVVRHPSFLKITRIRYLGVWLGIVLVLGLHKGKAGKAEYLYSELHGIQTTLKRSSMDHTVLPAINTISTVHQMAPPPIEVANI